MELIRTFSPDQYQRALDAWQWIGLDGLEPWFTSSFGDVFLIGADGVYWLDVAVGELTRPFTDAEHAQAVLGTDDGLDEYLLAGLVFAAEQAGLVAGEAEIFDFKQPPVLDGDFEVENLQVVDFEVALGRLGQLHEQIKDLPDGTEIGDVSTD